MNCNYVYFWDQFMPSVVGGVKGGAPVWEDRI